MTTRQVSFGAAVSGGKDELSPQCTTSERPRIWHHRHHCDPHHVGHCYPRLVFSLEIYLGLFRMRGCGGYSSSALNVPTGLAEISEDAL